MSAAGKYMRRVEGGYVHRCPGCASMPDRASVHVITTENPYPNGACWTFDGNLDAPTFSPSVRVGSREGTECHYFIKAGCIEYCSDSAHALAGQTVPMEPFNHDMWEPEP